MIGIYRVKKIPKDIKISSTSHLGVAALLSQHCATQQVAPNARAVVTEVAAPPSLLKEAVRSSPSAATLNNHGCGAQLSFAPFLFS